MSREELDSFDRVRSKVSLQFNRTYPTFLKQLLDEPDWDIYYWSIEKRDPPERWAGSTLLEKLKVHARNEGKVVRRMPELSD